MTMFNPVNIRKELLKERDGTVTEQELGMQVDELLNASAEEDALLIARLKKGKARSVILENIDISKCGNVFPEDAIRTICVNYRLRFLDTKFFKGEYPYEALLKIRAFEKENSVQVREFKIMAPTKMFRLIDPDKDPLLFASLGNGNYYLLHQWGNDLAWYRKILAWPLRSLQNLLISIVSLALMLSLTLPAAFFINGDATDAQTYTVRMMFFLLASLASFFLMINIGLRSNRSLSEVDWDNKYLH